ncbi:MAG: hypothetical protein NVS4B10_06950 [Myxococcales bacterium]
MKKAPGSWAAEWLDGVSDGTKTMSQRKLAAVEAKGGGLARLRREARARGVHLVVLVDDKGNELVAASLHPFRVLC